MTNFRNYEVSVLSQSTLFVSEHLQQFHFSGLELSLRCDTSILAEILDHFVVFSIPNSLTQAGRLRSYQLLVHSPAHTNDPDLISLFEVKRSRKRAEG